MSNLILSFLWLIVSMPYIVSADPDFALTRTVLEAASRKMSQESKTFTLGNALGALRKTSGFDPLFKHYTLAKRSDSLQEASPLAPRVILYGNTARLILTFNSDPSFEGGSAFESAEFDERSHRILFREIIFKAELPTRMKDALGKSSWQSVEEKILQRDFFLKREEIEFENAAMVITRPNPEKCMLCHSLTLSDTGYARYIWSNYLIWPGLYGKIDDKLTEEERRSLFDFKRKAVSHGRYSYLENITPPSSIYPYGGGPIQSGPFGSRANLLLTEFLSYRQAEEISSLLEEKLSAQEKARFTEGIRCREERLEGFDRALAGLFTDLELERVMSFDRSSLMNFTFWGGFYKALSGLVPVDLGNHTGGDATDFNSGYRSLLFSSGKYFAEHFTTARNLHALVKQELFRLLVAHDPVAAGEFAQMIEDNSPESAGYDADPLDGLSQESRDYLRARIRLGGKRKDQMVCAQQRPDASR